MRMIPRVLLARIVAFWFLTAVIAQTSAFAHPQSRAARASNASGHVIKPGGPAEHISWATGEELDRLVDWRLSTSWRDGRLRDQLSSFARVNRIAIFLDRRIDPGTRVTLSVKQATVEQFLWRVAETAGIGVCRIGDLYYFGPVETTQSLPSLWQRLEKSARRKSSSAFDWPRGASPEHLLEQIAQADHLKLMDATQVGHDVWPAGSLPRMSGAEKFALIALGFNQWIEYTPASNQIRTTNFPAPEISTVRYRLPPQNKIEKKDLVNHFDDCDLQVSRTSVSARGPAKSLAALKRFLVENPAAQPTTLSALRFSLKTSASRQQILRAIADQQNLQLIIADGVESLLSQQIQIECKDSTLDELLELILGEADLRYERSNASLRIVPR